MFLASTLCGTIGSAQSLPDWTHAVRQDHPRLFFNAETWPQVKTLRWVPSATGTTRSKRESMGC